MKVVFDNETEKRNVIATLQRLAETINERSHSTAEEMNLLKAITIVRACGVIDQYGQLSS